MPDDANAPDIADTLAAEAEEWLGRMAATGHIPRTFIAVTAREERLIVRLLEVDAPQAIREPFLQWLCRTVGVSAYAYISHVVDQDERESVTISASSPTRDIALMLAITRGEAGAISYTRAYGEARPAGGFDARVFGLQRSPGDTSRDEEFATIWKNWHGEILQIGQRSVN